MAKTKKKKTTNTRKKSSKKKAQKKSLFGFLVKWTFVVGLWTSLIVAAICAYYAAELPSITQNAKFERKTTIIIQAADGSTIVRYGDLVGEKVGIEDIPQNLIHAVLATEDRRFYQHFGIDPLGLARAMVVNAQKKRFAQGGSTITQQLAKNLFLSHERTIKRKIQEAMLAIWLEQELTKDEILSAYLNRVYLGSGAYGVDAASQLYFKKPVQEINLQESATLAGLLKAPSRYSPLQNPKLSRERTNVVLKAMEDAGYITKSNDHFMDTYIPKPTQRPDGNSERYYANWIIDELNTLIGTPNEDIIIETTMNPDIQKTAATQIADTINLYGEEKNMSQGAAVVMRPDGAVVALVGGVDYRKSQFNRATQAKRQPGSAFKPFVYLTAIDKGWDPQDIIEDAPILEGEYRPENFDDQYHGEVSLETGLTYSLNTVSYRLLKDIGPQSVIKTARGLGVTSPINADLSLSLGTNLVSPIEITSAYAAIINGGKPVDPYGITKITNMDGTLYYERPQKPNRNKRAVKRKSAFKLVSMMENVIQNGTGRAANFGNSSAAGKTGTSQNYRDAWFIGFTNRLVTGVWIGNDDNTPMNHVTGGSYPARIWKNIMMESNDTYPPYLYDIPFFGKFENMISQWGGDDTEGSYAHSNKRRYNN